MNNPKINLIIKTTRHFVFIANQPLDQDLGSWCRVESKFSKATKLNQKSLTSIKSNSSRKCWESSSNIGVNNEVTIRVGREDIPSPLVFVFTDYYMYMDFKSGSFLSEITFKISCFVFLSICVVSTYDCSNQLLNVKW